ncbi:hypothetical protein FSP39_022471 [Pinctada imbricata]|uniref:Uncharacterized protein n=2 Tax=Pinctada imbricata TaxID=66713 RepID=A0AA89C2T2_PINIB|nr:hypothetical protein FSP39_001472 [Pinctada imbricata]KAK3106551.1 hypothetical protein FSP39_022471 [Pinctada imbricata]
MNPDKRKSIDTFFKAPVKMNTRKSSQTVSSDKDKENDILALIRQDLRDVKERLDQTVKRDEIELLINQIVKTFVNECKKDIEEEVKTRVQQFQSSYNNEIQNLKEKIQAINLENENLLTKLNRCEHENAALKQRVKENEGKITKALIQSNHNEQYSRKTNIKIIGLKEERSENTKEVVKKVFLEKGGIEVEDNEITAVHRIPGRREDHRPILIKFRNTDAKSKVMRKRRMIKEAGGGIRLVDDVTKMNTELITRLKNHDKISGAWYFNSYVYGQHGNKRIRFDIFDDINSKIAMSV